MSVTTPWMLVTGCVIVGWIAPEEQEGYDGIAHDMERLRFGLENCRLLAARHRKEDWALLILGFCAEAGVAGSVTR